MKILAYSSALTFGGHEVMSTAGLRALLRCGHEVVLLYPAQNEKMREVARPLRSEFGDLFSTEETDFHARRLQVFFTWLDWVTLLRLKKRFQRRDADLVLVLQGDIEQGSEAVVAASIAKIPLVSYIPMVMRGRDRGIRFAALRDLLSKPLYRLIGRMIVISPAFEQKAKSLGTGEVRLVYNCIDTSFLTEPSSRDRTRERLGIRPDEFITGFVGRISYFQKGVDRLIAILQQGKPFFEKNRMLILGSGPDDARLTSDLVSLGLETLVLRVPWANDRCPYFDSMDMFLCSSRFEGVPLTVLEASVRDVPVISMPLPTLTDHLPLTYLSAHFDPKEWVDCVERAYSVRRRSGLGDLVRKMASPVEFQRLFEQAVVAPFPGSELPLRRSAASSPP